MTRLLVLFGSGETTPAFVTLHRELFARHGELTSASAVMLDTTYGFQTNADELTARLRGYFADSAGVDVGEVRLRSSNAGPGAVATAVDTVSTARWVFAGPGSPTYTARNWLATGMERAFTRVLEQGSLVFASAAAMSLGSHVMPVYEIYRVGQDPHWQPGLDVIGAALGVKAAVVAHYDNTEGGTHDTRYCFAGADRFATLEAQLPADTGVIGVDEHTAVVIDLDEESVAVHGRGATAAAGSSKSVAKSDAFGNVVFQVSNTVTKGEPKPAALNSLPPTSGAIFARFQAALSGSTATSAPVDFHFFQTAAPVTPTPVKKTIRCQKGKTIKKVTAVAPKCPTGFKKI